MKYKIGDIVKLTKANIHYWKNKNNEWWEIYNLKEDTRWIYIGGNRYQSCPEGSYFSKKGREEYATFRNDCQFELVEQKSKEQLLLDKIYYLYSKNKFTKGRGYDKPCSEKGTMP